MILELFIYEAVTTIGGLFGLKLWADKKYLKGINQPKSLPIDGYLKRQVGKMSKTEEFMATQAVKLIQNISKYRAFRYLLIIFGRRAYASAQARTVHNAGHYSVSNTGLCGWGNVQQTIDKQFKAIWRPISANAARQKANT